MKRLPSSPGQALLVVLLSMAVVLTIVLSVLSRSITDISITTREEEALRAFNAAEAGVERALITGSGEGQFEGSQFTASLVSFGEGSQVFNYPFDLVSGDVATIWFVAHNDEGDLACSEGKPCFTGSQAKFCWGNEGTSADSATTPAIEVSVYYATTPFNFATVKIGRETADPNAVRRGDNSFAATDAGSCSLAGVNYAFGKTISFNSLSIPAGVSGTQGGLLFARVRMLYNTDAKQNLGVDVDFAGNTLLPTQGVRIESVGTAGDATRKVEVFQAHTDLPSALESAVFSPAGLTK